MKFIPAIIVCLLLSTAGFAQTASQTYYFNNNNQEVHTRDSADYIRTISSPDSDSVYYAVSEYYKNGKAKLLGHTSTINPVTLQGQCIGFYENGKRKEMLNYAAGKLINQQYYYHANGKFKEERNYPFNVKDKSKLIDQLYAVTKYADSTGKMMATGGKGYYTNENISANGLVKWIGEGEIENGQKQGVWKVAVNKDSIQLVENYDKGKFISGKAIYANGETHTYTEPDRLPEFKGGGMAFSEFVGNKILYPAKDKGLNVDGYVVISAFVESDGSLTDIKTIGNVQNPTLAKEVVKILSRGPKWVPGRQFGRLTRISCTIPIGISTTLPN